MKKPFPAIAGLLPEEISEQLELSPSFRGMQIFKALWNGAGTFQEISTLPSELREELSRETRLLQTELHSINGKTEEAEKIALRCIDGYIVESVILTDARKRKTLCLSSQAGCGMGCVFCKTGTLGLTRNLSAAEICEQILRAIPRSGSVSNLVFMGMGEPLFNLPEIRKAAEIIARPEGLGMSLKRVTLSTCGIIRGIEDLRMNGPRFRLAVSLIAAEQKKREELLPIARNNPLDKLRDALLAYQKTTGKRITFEYVLLPGINDGPEDIRDLQSFTRNFSSVVNVIPWNPVEGMPFRSPTEDEAERFLRACAGAGIKCTRRYSKGREIGGACGQLGGSA